MPRSRAVRSPQVPARQPMKQMQRPISATPPRPLGMAKPVQPVMGTARPRPTRPGMRPKAPGKPPMPPAGAQGPNPQASALNRAHRALGNQKRKISARLPQQQVTPPAPANPIPAAPAFGPPGAADDQDQY